MELQIIEGQTIENNSIIRMTAAEVRDKFDETVDRVASSEKCVILSKECKDIAAVISIEQFCLLEHIIAQMEDEIDLEAVRAATAEKEGNISTSLEEEYRKFVVDGNKNLKFPSLLNCLKILLVKFRCREQLLSSNMTVSMYS